MLSSSQKGNLSSVLGAICLYISRAFLERGFHTPLVSIYFFQFWWSFSFFGSLICLQVQIVLHKASLESFNVSLVQVSYCLRKDVKSFSQVKMSSIQEFQLSIFTIHQVKVFLRSDAVGVLAVFSRFGH